MADTSPEDPGLRQPAHHRLYGRAKGKPLTEHQSGLMETEYPRMSVGDELPEGPLWMEIGFGAAHHLLHLAETNPGVTVIGAEPFLNGVAKAVAGAVERDIGNLRLHHGDAREVLAKLPDASLDRLFVLFPDPWPKARHHKRRLIQEDTISEFARVVRPGGTWRFASDIISYVDWVLVRVDREPEFAWEPENAESFLRRPGDSVETHYMRKALREGRVPHWFDFKRM